MNKEQLEKSLILLGPCGVGKTLIGEELSKKYDLPVFNVDYFLLFVSWESQKLIGPTKNEQEKFIQDLKTSTLKDPNYRETLTNPLFKEKQEMIIKNIITSYNFYRNLVGDLSQFYGLFNEHCLRMMKAKKPEEKNVAFCDLTNKLIRILIEKVDKAIIIDPPGPYGWKFCKNLNSKSCKDLALFGIDPKDVEQCMEKLLSQMRSVLLLPGVDYQDRNPQKNNVSNDMLVNHPENYHCCDLEITTNGLFFDPKNPSLQNREHLDARIMLEKERLKNSSEVKNISDEIQQRLDDLRETEIF